MLHCICFFARSITHSKPLGEPLGMLLDKWCPSLRLFWTIVGRFSWEESRQRSATWALLVSVSHTVTLLVQNSANKWNFIYRPFRFLFDIPRRFAEFRHQMRSGNLLAYLSLNHLSNVIVSYFWSMLHFVQIQPIQPISRKFNLCVTDGRTDGRTKLSYRDTRMQLKAWFCPLENCSMRINQGDWLIFLLN